MAVKIFLAFVTILACEEFLLASPTRRQFNVVTESSVSDSPATNEGEVVWDDNDEFDLDGQNWYSQPVASPSALPNKLSDFNDYEDDYTNNNNNNIRVSDNMADFGEDDDDDEEEQQQEAEETLENNANDSDANDSEFLFLPPRDTRLLLEDDDQSGPIKVRHTGRSSYPRVSEGSENSIESLEEDNEHPYEFAIDEGTKVDEDDDEDLDPHKDEGVDTVPRHEVHEVDDDDDEDEFVPEGEDKDMFNNSEEDAAQVIYGDHVFLY